MGRRTASGGGMWSLFKGLGSGGSLGVVHTVHVNGCCVRVCHGWWMVNGTHTHTFLVGVQSCYPCAVLSFVPLQTKRYTL